MKTGESSGGRPPYEPSNEEIKLAEELATEGLSLEQIAKCLDISDSTLRELKKRNANFSLALCKGRAKEFIECNRQIKKDGISSAIYIHWSKTKWRNFYPQEEKNQSGIDVENPPNLIINFTPPANHRADNDCKLESNREASI